MEGVELKGDKLPGFRLNMSEVLFGQRRDVKLTLLSTGRMAVDCSHSISHSADYSCNHFLAVELPLAYFTSYWLS